MKADVDVYTETAKMLGCSRDKAREFLLQGLFGVDIIPRADGIAGEPAVGRRPLEGANSRQVGGDHYSRAYQHWDLMSDLHAEYLPGQVTKYTERHAKKNGRQDLEKALHFAEKMRETTNPCVPTTLVAENAAHLVARYLSTASLTPMQAAIYTVTLLTPGNTDLIVDLCRLHLELTYPEEKSAPEAIYPGVGDTVITEGRTGLGVIVATDGDMVVVKADNTWVHCVPRDKVIALHRAAALRPGTPEDGGHHAAKDERS